MVAMPHDPESLSFPQFEGKWAFPSLYGPDDFLGWARSVGWDPGTMPSGVVFTYQGSVLAHLASDSDRYREVLALGNGFDRFFVTADGGVGIAPTGVGGPSVAARIENLTYMGVRRFVSIGTAGAISPGLSIGDVVVVDKALRDDGVSQHYLPPARFVEPSASLTEDVAGCLQRRGVEVRRGATWTVPTPYRVTAEEITTYTDEGIATVEMEAASVFAVGDVIGAETAAAVVISDLVGLDKTTVDWSKTIPLLDLLDAAVEVLAG
jgi:uridine phosphorylase